MTELTARELLVMLYQTALDAVDGRFLVNQWCRQHNSKSFTHCVAIGKAAAAMLQGALDCMPALQHSLLICPRAKITRQLKKNNRITCMAASHPVPDESSLEAGRALLSFLTMVKETDNILFLISGGTSSLVEVPEDNITLEQLQKINHYLLSSGKDIHQLNAWRQQFSKIKAGGLLSWLKAAPVTQLLLSDVKQDKTEFIGSGLLVTSSVIPEPDAYLSSFLPGEHSTKRAVVKQAENVIQPDSYIIGNLKLAMQAVHEAAIAEGLACVMHDEFLEGDACAVAEKLYAELENAPPGIHIWGGETTVKLPEKPGVGGRNQTLALAFAQAIDGHEGLHLLAAGTDGIDGNSNCAGAVVSAYTAKKARTMGFDIKAEIAQANTGMVLMATDDLLQAEQSNTNVMDIAIAYKLAP